MFELMLQCGNHLNTYVESLNGGEGESK
ncbi:hypothetical protein EAG_03201 [Camponotus floridanus]|uniref:Uncharacterized protein n=1 Tax=Camponotus floridanus TaxID=104421 RepID=E2AAX8_CAMFO|nr:hypothetical protein EAG_03201 [Camponotus floridanus]